MISKDSSLRYLPDGLTDKQVLIFDGISYSIAMADVACERLYATLHKIAPGDRDLGDRDKTFASAMQDAWSIVDSINRLRTLLARVPGMKQNYAPRQVFLRQTKSIEDLRHNIQHVDTEIDALMTSKQPIWGILAWAIVDPAMRKAYSCILVAATQLNARSYNVPDIRNRDFQAPLDFVTINANGYSASLSDTMRSTMQLVPELEKWLVEQFGPFKDRGVDLFARVDYSSTDNDLTKTRKVPDH